jgi:ribosomal protein L37E
MSEAQIERQMLWICDLQKLLPEELRPRMCEAWNQFWSNLWKLREHCGQCPQGHGPFVTKGNGYFSVPNHVVCTRCGTVAYRGATTVMATTMSPGFPQGPPPTTAQYNAQREQQAQRNAETRRDALESINAAHARAANELANVIEPLGVTYSLAALKRSGQLLDGFRLNLSTPGTVTNQLERMKDTVRAEVLAEVLKVVRSSPSTPTPAPPPRAAPPATNINRGNQPPVQPARPQQVPNVPEVAAVSPAPAPKTVSWTSVVKRPANPTRYQRCSPKLEEAAKVAVKTAMVAILPTASASGSHGST